MICTSNKFNKAILTTFFILLVVIMTIGFCASRIEKQKKEVVTEVVDVPLEEVVVVKEPVEAVEVVETPSEKSKIDPQSNNNPSVTNLPSNNKTFRVSAYCACEVCCDKSDGITATGVKATAGRTIAVDPNVIPLGSVVVLNGHEYVAEDVGGSIKGNKLDIYFESHQEALNFGVQHLEGEVIRQ